MTTISENVLMITYSLKYFKGHTSEKLKEKIDWLKNISIYGVEFYLKEGVRKGFIYTKIKKNNIVYYPTVKGLYEYENNF